MLRTLPVLLLRPFARAPSQAHTTPARPLSTRSAFLPGPFSRQHCHRRLLTPSTRYRLYRYVLFQRPILSLFNVMLCPALPTNRGKNWDLKGLPPGREAGYRFQSPTNRGKNWDNKIPSLPSLWVRRGVSIPY